VRRSRLLIESPITLSIDLTRACSWSPEGKGHLEAEPVCSRAGCSQAHSTRVLLRCPLGRR